MVNINDILKEQDKEKREKLIDERLKELNSLSEQNKEVDLDAIHKGFISSTSTLDFSSNFIMFGDIDYPLKSTYTMKKQDYIPLFIEYIKKHNIINPSNVINAISPFLHEYFGCNADYTNKYNREISFDNMGNRLGEMKSKSEDLFNKYYQEWFDIGIFKGKSMAECTEYAALSQNILAFLGIITYYISGNFSSSEKSEAHAFNLIQLTPEDCFLVDFSNPTILYDEEFNVIDSQPRKQKISVEEFADAVHGNGFSIKFNSNNYQRIDGKDRKVDMGSYTYEIKAKKKINQI